MRATVSFGDRPLSLADIEFLTRSRSSTAQICARREEPVRPPGKFKPSGSNPFGQPISYCFQWTLQRAKLSVKIL